MQDLPHFYKAAANADSDSAVIVSSEGVPSLETAGPVEFGGPGDVWSPEDLLVAAVADCFILTFRAMARASKLEWSSLSCNASGTLDKLDKVTQFTQFDLSAELTIPPGTDESKAERLLQRAEHHCLITNSLKAGSTLDTKIITAA
ncbi:MAG: OsmC family protein [Gammaproteobacteria bacterium]|nr:OsmC family protein [Gammaproteobacteria bacterium]